MTTFMGTMSWFGGYLPNVPMYRDEHGTAMPRVATPVGKECGYCEEGIVLGEVGVVMPALLSADGVVQMPIHIECHLRSMLGGLAHQRQECSCFGGSDDHSQEMTYREEARLVIEKAWGASWRREVVRS